MSVDIPETIKLLKFAEPSTSIEFDVNDIPVPTFNVSFSPSIIIPVTPKVSDLKVVMPVTFKEFKLLCPETSNSVTLAVPPLTLNAMSLL